MRSFNSPSRAAPAMRPPPKVPAPPTESAAGEEDPGSALDTQPETLDDDEDPDLAFMDEDLALPPAQEIEDESADPVGDGHSDAELAATQPPAPPRPDLQRKPPRKPLPASGDETETPSEDLGDAESHKPGRD
jgi:hypothetical protein